MTVRLPRLQLFEHNDSPRVPASLRDTLVAALGGSLERGRVLDGVVAPFAELLERAGTREVLDVGSGSGAPARLLAQAFVAAGRPPPRMLLTDLFPQVAQWEAARAALPEAIDFVREPVDATRLPEHLARGRVCSIVNVLHHLPPETARSVLLDAVRVCRGLFVVEGFERNPLRFAAFAPSGIRALAATPLLPGPGRTARALYAWATPIALLTAIWDGVISTLRVHEIGDLERMTAQARGWRFGSGHYRFGPGGWGRGFYFWGLPDAAT